MVVTRSWEMRNDDLLVAEFLLGQFQVLEMANRDSYTDVPVPDAAELSF